MIMKLRGSTGVFRPVCGMVCIAFASISGVMSAQQTLSPEVYGTLSTSVFEVVTPKREQLDAFEYAEELPFDQLPFVVRTDPFTSVGTAFCTSPGRYLSAAHVFALENDSANGDFFLRNAEGRVFEVDQVFQYSNHRDFILFSIKNEPGHVPLERAPETTVNSRVFTVGNAHGQGVIVRDGVLTSMTGEERDGAWKWLRFSAAASPGNSGGPLVDSSGRVLGIIVARSENENFNLALPLSAVDEFPEDTAWINQSIGYGVPFFSYTERAIEDTKETLPLPLGELRGRLTDARNTMHLKLLSDLMAKRDNVLFPKAKGSDYLLANPHSSLIPGVACEQSDYSWKMEYGDDGKSADLSNGDRFEWRSWKGYDLQRYFRPEGVYDRTAFVDAKTSMEAVLGGYPLYRSMAGKSVRITSLGSPSRNEARTDRYGRVWSLSVWPIVFADRSMVWLRLPTPDGFVAFLAITGDENLYATIADLGAIIQLTDVDYSGSIEQWIAFLSRSGSDLASNSSAARGRAAGELADFGCVFAEKERLTLRTEEFALKLEYADFAFDQNTVLQCFASWTALPGGGTVRSVNSLFAAVEGTQAVGIGLYRISRPGWMDSAERKTAWKNLAEEVYPYNGQPLASDGYLWTYAGVDVAPFIDGETDLLSYRSQYLLQLRTSARTSAHEAKSSFAALTESASVSETGILRTYGADNAKIRERMRLSEISGYTIFEAIAKNKPEILNRFIEEKKDLEALNALSRTPLIAAAASRREEMAICLIRAGVDLDATDRNGMTALMAALETAPEKVSLELVRSGASVAPLSKFGKTALAYALYGKKPAAARLLIEKGADVQLAVKDGSTPLHLAVQYADAETVKLLLERNANPHAENETGETPESLAKKLNKKDILELFLR
ncbi:MAG: hypothetical protein EWM51_08270 [Treponema sp.]|nr:MAG: hypothetical protein EWM51_08270 [Treponema sp.]